jgi:hypothetical protein
MNSRDLANAKLTEVTGTDPNDWNVSDAPVSGIGDEFFFTLKTNENRFVYICVENGTVTSTETN